MKLTATEETTIRSGEAYPLPDFARRTGLGRHGLRAARRSGLQVRRVHGRAYVLGSDWLRYLESAGGATTADAIA